MPSSFLPFSHGYEKQMESMVAKMTELGMISPRVLVVGCGNSRMSADLHHRLTDEDEG
jgi:hypothetical protein